MPPQLSGNWQAGTVGGPGVETSAKTLGAIRGIFHDQQAAARLPAELELYRVNAYTPTPDGTEGGLFWGDTTIEPGVVGDEYFMTRGHFHSVRNRVQYYATVRGAGALVLMGEAGARRCEWMRTGALHYIPGHTAHRVANTGGVALVFTACWPSDAGHDYETIEREGFSGRVVERGGRPLPVDRGGRFLAERG